jgi:hypothetical protein
MSVFIPRAVSQEEWSDSAAIRQLIVINASHLGHY